MDCSYKMNKYKIPLLNIVSVTGFNKVLFVAQCWLPGETEADYVWAIYLLRLFIIEKNVAPPGLIVTDRDLAFMNAVGHVLAGIPAMVCRWHMNKTVVARARRVLDQESVVLPAPGQPKYENSRRGRRTLSQPHFINRLRSEPELSLSRCATLWRPCLPLSQSIWMPIGGSIRHESSTVGWTSTRTSAFKTHLLWKALTRNARGEYGATKVTCALCSMLHFHGGTPRHKMSALLQKEVRRSLHPNSRSLDTLLSFESSPSRGSERPTSCDPWLLRLCATICVAKRLVGMETDRFNTIRKISCAHPRRRPETSR